MAGQLRVDEITDEAGTGAPSFPNKITPASLGTGTPGAGNFLRGDGSWEAVPSADIASTAEAEAGTNNTNFITPLRMREGFNATGSAPVYACRAWVNFNGTGTVAIRASGNVSSITDRGTGQYTVNLSNALPDANGSYNASFVRGTGDLTGQISISRNVTITTTAFGIDTQTTNGSSVDEAFIFAAVHR